MRIRFVSISIFVFLTFFVLPAFAADADTWESFQCTMPSSQLLLPDSVGGPMGALHSFIAGSTVFIEGGSSYMKCLGNTAQHNASVAGHAVMKVVRALFGMKQEGAPGVSGMSAPSQPPEQ